MKKVKVFTVNAGGHHREDLFNDNWLHAESYRGINFVIEGFMKEGWRFIAMQPMYLPALLEEGNWSFYKGGLMLVFEKDVNEDEDDGAEELMVELLDQLPRDE